MKIIKFLPLFLIGLLFVTSCSNDDDTPSVVTLSVTLINKDGSIATEGEAKEITYEVILSRSLNTELKLTFGVNNPDQNKGFFEIENPVVIRQGKTKGTLKVKVLPKVDAYKELTKNATFTLNLKSVEGIIENITFDNTAYSFIIKPKADIIPLTEAQRKLIKHYEENGIDIAQWIGEIPVKVTVITGAKGNIEAFATSHTFKYSGFTHITLSENATQDKPLLKMTHNAFGISEYLQWVFRNETIENTNFWMQQPAPQAVMQALGQERVDKWKNREYEFNVSVDNILVQDNNNIQFVYKDGAYDTYTNFLNPDRKKNLSAVDFVYEFPLWNELVELAEGNEPLKTNIEQGGSIYPNNYIGYSTILSDDWGRGNWVEPKGTYDTQTGEMKFIFNTDHSGSGSYDIVKVTFTSPY